MFLRDVAGLFVGYGSNSQIFSQASRNLGNSAMTSSGHKLAVMGRVLGPRFTGTKSISKIHFYFGTLSGHTSCELTATIEGRAAGYLQPDGTPVATSSALSLSSATSNSWSSFTFASPPSVSYGDRIACVIAYSTFSGTPSVAIAGGGETIQGCGSNYYNGTSWVTNGDLAHSVGVIEFSDGSFGSLRNNLFPGVYSGGGFAGEIGNTFTFNSRYTIFGALIRTRTADNSASLVVRLYDNTTELTASSDFELADAANGAGGWVPLYFPNPYVVIPNKEYIMGLKSPDGDNKAYYYKVSVGNANHKKAIDGGDKVNAQSRSGGGGSWTPDTTSVYAILPIISKIPFATSGV